MLLSLYLAFCLTGFATSRVVYDVQAVVPVEPDYVEDGDCGCSKEPAPQCGCCAEFEFDKKEHKVCMNMTYEEKEKGLRFTVIFDGKVLLNETLSAKNPPPICQGVCPISCICVKYYNMSYGDDHKWGGCLKIYGDILIPIVDIELGCFYLPVNGSQEQWKPTDKSRNSLLNFDTNLSTDDILNNIQQWFLKMLRQKTAMLPNKGKNPVDFLFNNRVDDENDNNKVPNMY